MCYPKRTVDYFCPQKVCLFHCTGWKKCIYRTWLSYTDSFFFFRSCSWVLFRRLYHPLDLYKRTGRACVDTLDYSKMLISCQRNLFSGWEMLLQRTVYPGKIRMACIVEQKNAVESSAIDAKCVFFPIQPIVTPAEVIAESYLPLHD